MKGKQICVLNLLDKLNCKNFLGTAKLLLDNKTGTVGKME